PSLFTFALVRRVAGLNGVYLRGVGVVVSGHMTRINPDPHPHPLPSLLRACSVPANLVATKPRQAGVWVGRGSRLSSPLALIPVQRTCARNFRWMRGSRPGMTR